MSEARAVSAKVRSKAMSYFRNVFAFTDDVSVGLVEKLEQTILSVVPKLEQAVAAKDAAKAREELHALKGVVANGGLEEEAGLAAKLMALAGEGRDWGGIAVGVASLVHKLIEPAEASGRYRVLVVDDMMFVREFTKSSLSKLFPKVQTFEAATGQAALELLAREPFDLVLCDWELPGAVKGIDVLKGMREGVKSEKTPFVMLTSNGDKEHVIQAKQHGADDYMLKPVKLDILASKVRDLLKMK